MSAKALVSYEEQQNFDVNISYKTSCPFHQEVQQNLRKARKAALHTKPLFTHIFNYQAQRNWCCRLNYLIELPHTAIREDNFLYSVYVAILYLLNVLAQRSTYLLCDL